MARRKASDFVEGRVKGGSLGLGHFEIVRCWAFKEEFFQAWIPKIRISTKPGTKPHTLLTLTWHTPYDKPRNEYSVFVHAIDNKGNTLFQFDH